MGAVSNMSWIRAYGIFIALVIFSITKIQAHPFAKDGPKWRPFNSIMNGLSSNKEAMEMMPANPMALHGLPNGQEEDSADVSDFVSNLRSALRNEISALIDMEEAQQGYPAYSITHKRRFVPQQLMG